MAAQIFDGKAFAQTLLTDLTAKIALFGKPPILAIVMVGDNEASLSYIRQKLKAGSAIGAQLHLFTLAEDIDQSQLEQAVIALQHGNVPQTPHQYQSTNNAAYRKPNALIIQRPMPAQIAVQTLFAKINPALDIDGFHKQSPYLPPVGLAIIEILAAIFKTDKSILAKRLGEVQIAIVGSGETAGKPIIRTLEHFHLTPNIINKMSENPINLTRQADIVITAVGKSNFVTADWIKPGAIVLDVGISRIVDKDSGRVGLNGDCDPSVQAIARVVTPVPGGVGPVNVACLMQNLVAAAHKPPVC